MMNTSLTASLYLLAIQYETTTPDSRTPTCGIKTSPPAFRIRSPNPFRGCPACGAAPGAGGLSGGAAIGGVEGVSIFECERPQDLSFNSGELARRYSGASL